MLPTMPRSAFPPWGNPPRVWGGMRGDFLVVASYGEEVAVMARLV